MEGLPRMPMLSVELKYCPASTDFGPKLKEYIAQFYQENPESYSKEIEELNQLRENAIKAPADFTGCCTLKKYFAQLHLLKSRFPMEENDAAAVPFTWYEKFNDMPSPVSYEDVRYELSCILHNIGATHSYLATVDSRMTSEGMKVSCTHFQCAAWAFHTLRDNSEQFRYSASSFSPDFDQNILEWYAILMLAQAQECILEKSLVDNRKAHIIAKVAAQVSEYYAQAGRVVESSVVSDVVGSHKTKSWRKFVDMKRKFYRAIAYYELGTQSDEQQKMGERLAYFQAAANDLAEAAKYGYKDSSDSIHQSLQFTEDVIVARLNQAKKENDFIYHEKIPSMDSLPELKGASLVKAIPFDPLDVDVSGGDIFKRLIPLEVHRTSSLYSEEKAKLLRRISDDVDAKNASLEEFMMSLKVDQLKLDVDYSQLPLPEALLERCAAFNAKPSAVSDLLAQMSKLTDSYQDVEASISEIEKAINLSDKESKNIMASLYGVSGDDHQAKVPNDIRASIGGRLKTFREEVERYRRAHDQATKANTELHKAMSAHSENLNSLSLPLAELKRQLPSPPANLAELAETAEMKRLLGKVDEMKRQRDTLMEQLRLQVRDDDVTKVLLAAKDKDEQEVFSKGLKKHEKQIGIIEQNLAAQENIIKALTEANAKYGEIRKQINASTKQRDAKILNLIGAYDVYQDLEAKSKEGIEFYEKLKKSLQDLETSLIKWNDTDMESLRNKNKAEQEKRTMALESRKPSAMTSVPSQVPSMSSSANEPVGPKLKDYMAYYRAKKAGQAPQFPPTGGTTPMPASMAAGAHPTMPSNMAFPISGYNGMSAVPGMDGAYSMAGHSINGSIPSHTAPNGTMTVPGMEAAYHHHQHQAFPTSAGQIPFSVSNYPPATGMNGTYSTPAISGGYSMPPASTAGGYSMAGSTTGYSASAFPSVNVTAPASMLPSHGQHYTNPQAVSSGYHPTGGQPFMNTMHHPMPTSINRQDAYVPTSVSVAQTSVPNSYTPYMPTMTSSTPQHTVVNSGPGTALNYAPLNPVYAPTTAPQQVMQPTAYGHGYSSIHLEPVAFGSDYVQLRWRYDGPKPAKYMITFRGYQRFDSGMGRFEEQEVDMGAPVKLDADHYIVHNLRPDTTYAFEVSVVDETTGRIYVKSPTVRVNTNSSLL